MILKVGIKLVSENSNFKNKKENEEKERERGQEGGTRQK